MLPPRLQRIAAEAWRFRWRVEREAELRFARMAGRLRAARASATVVSLAERAASDEGRHAVRCAELSEALGWPVDAEPPTTIADVAPPSFNEHQSLTYEVVAACCIAETESNGTLLALLKSDPPPEPRVKEILRELAADEVEHARLGWAFLAQPALSPRPHAFLAPLIPHMLIHAEPFYLPSADPESESEELLTWGVLPFRRKRRVFSEMLREVIIPGLEHFGIDGGPTREWLARMESAGP